MEIKNQRNTGVMARRNDIPTRETTAAMANRGLCADPGNDETGCCNQAGDDRLDLTGLSSQNSSGITVAKIQPSKVRKQTEVGLFRFQAHFRWAVKIASQPQEMYSSRRAVDLLNIETEDLGD